MSQQRGEVAERWARDYLEQQGLTWVKSNYRCRLGEIDLIMLENNLLVFVEVRARVSMAFGGAMASVSRDKQKKLIKTAWLYMMGTGQEKSPFRFDVVAIEGPSSKKIWIKNAFGSDD